MEVHVGPGDLARISIAPGLDPLRELQGVSHRSLRLGDPVFGHWVRELGDDTHPSRAALLRTMRSGPVQIAGFNMGHTGTADFDARLDVALREPSSSWRDLRERLTALGLGESARILDTRHLDHLAWQIKRFYDDTFRTDWPYLNSLAGVAVRSWVDTLARDGVEALLDGLHPEVTWRKPVLAVDRDAALTCPAGCPHQVLGKKLESARLRISAEGLSIVPSIFAEVCVVDGTVRLPGSVDVSVLVVPIRLEAGSLARRSRAVELEALLGPTRAWVLTTLAEEARTTSSLARVVGISASSASEHAAVLRAGGLVSSERRGREVVHRATALAVALLGRSGRPEGTRAP